ncbi:MAG: dephospho-CoA kinase [Flavobacteriaceae bacterium]|nr:dephospho-CoA kinase [Flavobacteriaceae bacterium]
MPKIIGLTGGIGSGKTRVVKVFSDLGVPCYIADNAAKELMAKEASLIKQIKDLFGAKAYNTQGLNRAYIGAIVFSDLQKLQALNAIVHPAVAKDFSLWLALQKAPYVIKEVAILFETGGYKAVDQTLLITAPKEVRLQRAMQRDQVAKEVILSRMNHQWEDEQRIPLADHIINNDIWEETLKEIKRLHTYFLSLSLH